MQKRLRPASASRASALVMSIALTAACGGGGGGGSTPTDTPPPGNDGGDSTTVEIFLDEFSYSPTSIIVAPGTTVRWVLRGEDTTHTVTALDGSFDSGFGFAQQGATFEHEFGQADDGTTFEYSCASHADCCDMKGSIRVGNSAPPPDSDYQ